MKTFKEFIFECYCDEPKSKNELIAEARGGPDYDYEQSFVNLYNHMVNKSNSQGKNMREMFRKAVRTGDMFTVTDLIAKEIQRAQTDPTSPLYFDNLDPKDLGYTGGERVKKGSNAGEIKDKEAHREAYYNKLLNQQYSLLNFVQSESGKIQAGNGNIAEREGATKISLTPKAREITGKDQDTSKVDVSFVDNRGRKFGMSLKDAQGAVVNSSGAEETKAYILLGMNSLLDQQEQSGEITPEQRAEKESMGKELADQLALYMSSTRGMSKEQQKDALPQMQEYLNSIESVIPGTIQAMSSEAITGKGKYGDASTVDALFSTGRGGEVIEDPSWLAQYVFQRGRLGKGQTKPKEGPRVQRPTTITGDIKNYQDAEDKPKDSEYLKKWREEWGVPAWEKKIASFEPEIQDEIKRLQSTGEFSLKDLSDFETADIRSKQVRELEQQETQAQATAQSTSQQVAKAEQEAAAAAEIEAQASKESQAASIPVDANGEPVLNQYRKNINGHFAADPTTPLAKINAERRQAANNNLASAQNNLAAAQNNLQITQNNAAAAADQASQISANAQQLSQQIQGQPEDVASVPQKQPEATVAPTSTAPVASTVPQDQPANVVSTTASIPKEKPTPTSSMPQEKPVVEPNPQEKPVVKPNTQDTQDTQDKPKESDKKTEKNKKPQKESVKTNPELPQ